MRNSAYHMLLKSLEGAYDPSESRWLRNVTLEDVARGVERGVARVAGGDTVRYKHTVRDIVSNVASSGGEKGGIVQRLSAGELLPEQVAELQREDLSSDQMRADVSRMRKDYAISPGVYLKRNAVAGLYTCFRCKSDKTRFEMYQSRSGDEPMTVAVECLLCGNRWKH